MTPEHHEFDIAVLGGGPAGYVAAIRASQLKLKTVIIEPERLGGVCLNWGCIPTKALLKSADLYLEARRLGKFGIDAEVKGIDFGRIIARSRQVANRSSAGVEYLVKKNRIVRIAGKGRLLSAGNVEVVDRDSGEVTAQVRARHIIIATGGSARGLPGVEFDEQRVVTSKEAMSLQSQPQSLVVIGAGAIGVELAYFYAALGTKVTLLEMLDQALPLEDPEVSAALERSLSKLGIDIHTGTAVRSVQKDSDGVTITSQGAGGELTFRGELALVAVGVGGNTEGIGLDRVGVKIERSFAVVNKKYQTDVPGIWAIGDVIGPPLLAHVASREAICCVEEIAGLGPAPVDYDGVPSCTYCQPQVASVGFTETACREKGIDVTIGRFPFVASGKAQAAGEIEGFVKVICDAKSGRLLGAHLIGSGVTELIAELALARSLGATNRDILHSMHPHPTLSEAVMEATADSLGEAIHL